MCHGYRNDGRETRRCVEGRTHGCGDGDERVEYRLQFACGQANFFTRGLDDVGDIGAVVGEVCRIDDCALQNRGRAGGTHPRPGGFEFAIDANLPVAGVIENSCSRTQLDRGDACGQLSGAQCGKKGPQRDDEQFDRDHRWIAAICAELVSSAPV